MLMDPFDLLEALPPFEAVLVRRIYLDGDPLVKISRECGVETKRVKAALATALERLRLMVRVRGITSVADVL